MNTHFIGTQQDQIVHQPATRSSCWTGWFSLALALAGIILICIGDPYLLGLLSCVVGILAGWHVLHHHQENHVGAHLGFNLGLLGLLLWLLLIVLLTYVLKMDIASLFEIPKYQ